MANVIGLCVSCKHWDRLDPKNNEGICNYEGKMRVYVKEPPFWADLITESDFGCIAWRQKK